MQTQKAEDKYLLMGRGHVGEKHCHRFLLGDLWEVASRMNSMLFAVTGYCAIHYIHLFKSNKELSGIWKIRYYKKTYGLLSALP